jgi:predicted ATPase
LCVIVGAGIPEKGSGFFLKGINRCNYIYSQMKITKLHIENYKSIKGLRIENPNPFTVFVGPNGAGKSNIFEAIEFGSYFKEHRDKTIVVRMFKGVDSFKHYNIGSGIIKIDLESEIGNLIGLNIVVNYNIEADSYRLLTQEKMAFESKEKELNFSQKFSRIFLNNAALKKINTSDEERLNLDGSNVETVLNRVLKNSAKKEEIVEWLQLLIPEFKDIRIDTSGLSGEINYVVYENGSDKPFPKHLLSDGTKNILALLTLVFQSDEPQFLCIEEPENGLHPQAIKHLVELFRSVCKEKGHYIWLNSHSQSLVSQLTVNEIITVNKKEGVTQVQQFRGEDLYGLKMDEAWLTNALGGGIL